MWTAVKLAPEPSGREESKREGEVFQTIMPLRSAVGVIPRTDLKRLLK
jgi:hypothetical protein